MSTFFFILPKHVLSILTWTSTYQRLTRRNISHKSKQTESLKCKEKREKFFTFINTRWKVEEKSKGKSISIKIFERRFPPRL